jgi:mRNA interferase MazF
MERLKQYEIWWAVLPAPAGRRPVLLLSRDSAYLSLNRILCAEITSTIRNIAVEVPLGRAEGLARKCVANLDNVRPVAKHRLDKRIGQLPLGRRVEAKRALGFALAWDELIEAV